MGSYQDILSALVVLQNGMAPHETVVRALLAASGRKSGVATASGTVLLNNTTAAMPQRAGGPLALLVEQGAITGFQRERIEQALPALERQERAQLIEAALVRQGIPKDHASLRAKEALTAPDGEGSAATERYSRRWRLLLEARCADDADLAFCRLALEQGMVSLPQLDEAFKLAAVSTKGRSPVELLLGKAVLTAAQVQKLQGALPDYLRRLKSEAEAAPKPVPGDETAAKPRQQIPGFRLLEKLGAGAMGAVFRAEAVESARIVAIKVLPPDLDGADAQFVKRFAREANTLCAMDHPHIIRGLQLGQTERFSYFVMEFAEGVTAGDALKRRGAFSEAEALRIGDEIASALEYLHQRGIVHRDIKPDNIMVTKAGPAKLLDLGLVKRGDTQQSVLTTDGMVMGTPHYMAPEQVREAHEVDIRADIYSLGATLFHMLTGQRCFSGHNAMQIIQQHLKQPPPDPRALKPELSEACAGLLLKMLAKDPKKRYQDPTTLRNAIRQVRSPER